MSILETLIGLGLVGMIIAGVATHWSRSFSLAAEDRRNVDRNAIARFLIEHTDCRETTAAIGALCDGRTSTNIEIKATDGTSLVARRGSLFNSHRVQASCAEGDVTFRIRYEDKGAWKPLIKGAPLSCPALMPLTVRVPGGCRHVFHTNRRRLNFMNHSTNPAYALYCSFPVSLDRYAPNFASYSKLKVKYRGNDQTGATNRAPYGWDDGRIYPTESTFSCAGTPHEFEADVARMLSGANVNQQTTCWNCDDTMTQTFRYDRATRTVSVSDNWMGIGDSRWFRAAGCVSDVVLELTP